MKPVIYVSQKSTTETLSAFLNSLVRDIERSQKRKNGASR